MLDRPLVWCVLPLKNEALYDLEPAYFSDETGETNKQALTAALAQVEGLTVIDAEAPLVTGTLADRERYFYKTDFHWNARGGLRRPRRRSRGSWPEQGGSRRLLSRRRRIFSGRSSAANSDTRGISTSGSPTSFRCRRTSRATSPKTRRTCAISSTRATSSPSRVRRSSAADWTKDPVTYNDVFTYNLGYYRAENPAAPEAASVLILKDSFQNATIDYLSAIFRSVTVVDPRSYQETPDLASLLDADGIDLVLFFYHQNNVSRELIDFLSA